MIKFLLAILLLIPLSSYSQELYFTVGSYHTKRTSDCEFNPGVLYENKNRYIIGAYSNSNCDLVLVGGRNIFRSPDISLGITESRIIIPAGVAVGYTKYPILPFILPTYEIDINDQFSVAFSVIPKKDPIFGLGFKYRLR